MEIFYKVERSINYVKLRSQLEFSCLTYVNINNHEAILILTSLIYCKKTYKKFDFDYKDVFKLVKSGVVQFKLLSFSDTLSNLDVAYFLNQPIAKKYSLNDLDQEFIDKINNFKTSLCKIRDELRNNIPKNLIETRYFRKIFIDGNAQLRMKSTFTKAKDMSLPFSLASHPIYKSFAVDISFIIPKGTMFSCINFFDQISTEKYATATDTEVQIRKYSFFKSNLGLDVKNLKLVRAHKTNDVLTFSDILIEGREPELEVLNGMQIALSNDKVFMDNYKEYYEIDNFLLSYIGRSYSSKIAVEHFIDGQTHNVSQKDEWLEFDYLSTRYHESIEKGWVILSAGKNDQDYLNFYNNITDTLTQTISIDIKSSMDPIELSGRYNFTVVKYNHEVLKTLDNEKSEEFEYSSISSVEISHESEPKEPITSDSTQTEPTQIPIKPDLTSSSSSNTVGIIIAIASILAIVVMISIGYYYYRKNYK